MTSTGFKDKTGILHADDIDCHKLAEEFGTPLFVYSASVIHEQIAALQSALKNNLSKPEKTLITYACKANSHRAVLNLSHQHGLGADVVSGGEMRRALEAGIPAHKIVFSGVGKRADEIAYALEQNILQLNVESAPELKHIETIARQEGQCAPVAFRLNPNIDAGTHDKITTGKDTNKFGLPADDVLDLYNYAVNSPHLSPRGISMHIGSQITSITPYQGAFKTLAGVATTIQKSGLPLESLDIGGGLGIRYHDEPLPDLEAYARLIEDIIAPLGTQIILEPGRFITGPAGILLSKLLYIKETKAKRFLILDAGMNDLVRPSFYDAYHPIRPVIAAQTDKNGTLLHDVVGPVCETGDTFAKDRPLPADLKEGDLIAIMVCGAYGYVMSSTYNSRPRPPEVIVSGDKYELIRKGERFEDIIRGETVPEWLTDLS